MFYYRILRTSGFLAQLELKLSWAIVITVTSLSVCMYVCVSGCPRSPSSPKLLDQILPNLTGGCSRTSRCAIAQMILIWLALWPQNSNGQRNLWVNPHVGTGMDGWSASWNSPRVIAAGSLYLGRVTCIDSATCREIRESMVQYPRVPPGVEEQHSISIPLGVNVPGHLVGQWPGLKMLFLSQSHICISYIKHVIFSYPALPYLVNEHLNS